MLDSKKNKLTNSILGQLKKKGVPSVGPIDVMPEMDQSPGDIDQDLDAMGRQIKAAPSSPLLSRLKKPLDAEDEEVYG